MNQSYNESILSKLNIPSSGNLILAFSGGSDSLALLFLLSLVAKDRTTALYVNHNIRSAKELEEEIKLNKANTEKLGITLIIKTLDTNTVFNHARKEKCGVEAAARELRYKALYDYADTLSNSYILTAHHREDQVESIIMRLLENAPFYALSGINAEEGKIVRPMLNLTKAEINELLKLNNLNWSKDSTNDEIAYKRNYIRHKIATTLSEYDKNLLIKISNNVREYKERYANKINLKYSFYVELSCFEFLSALPFEQDDVIYKINSYFCNKERVSRSFIREIVKKAKEGRGKIISPSLTIYFQKDCIKFYRALYDFVFPYESKSIGPFTILSEKRDEKTLLIDESLLIDPIIRTSREGDEINLKEGKKKISELEKEYKIPYSLVLEDRLGIVALFARVFGGRDRLSSRFLGKGNKPISIEFLR